MSGRIFYVWATILLLSLVFTPSLKAEIFRWADDDGAIHYSDQPEKNKNSERVDESNLITYSNQPVKTWKNKKSRRLPVPRTTPKKTQKQKQYRAEGSSNRGNYSGGTSARPSSTRGSSSRGSSTRRY